MSDLKLLLLLIQKDGGVQQPRKAHYKALAPYLGHGKRMKSSSKELLIFNMDDL